MTSTQMSWVQFSFLLFQELLVDPSRQTGGGAGTKVNQFNDHEKDKGDWQPAKDMAVRRWPPLPFLHEIKCVEGRLMHQLLLLLLSMHSSQIKRIIISLRAPTLLQPPSSSSLASFPLTTAVSRSNVIVFDSVSPPRRQTFEEIGRTAPGLWHWSICE
jgi:hypothetical protein